MSTRKAANKSNKYILDKCFKPLEEFLCGKLPTLKQVLERCLHFKDYRKDSVQREEKNIIMDDYESVLLVKPEVFVYRIPPRTTSRGYRAADWNLGSPDWTGRMRLVVKNKKCLMKLEDKLSGELFAQSPIDKYPGIAIEAVTDSSRYFVIRIEDDGDSNLYLTMEWSDKENRITVVGLNKAGKAAFIGLGFGDRSDSFDMNVALQDHFKWVKKEEGSETDEIAQKPCLDLGFKEGETIKINMKIAKKDGQETQSSTKQKPRNAGTGLGLLPPPPGGVKIPPPSSPHRNSPSNVDLLGTNVPPLQSNISPSNLPTSAPSGGSEPWGEFASANPVSCSEPEITAKSATNPGWVTF